MYVTLSEEDKVKLLNGKEVRKYKYVGHTFSPMKGIGKQICKTCGLVALNNDITRWCIDKGCFHDVHPSYKSKIRKAGGMDVRGI